jgi:hypothetical protein
MHPPAAGKAGSVRPTSWSLGRSGGDHAFGAAVSDLTPRGPKHRARLTEGRKPKADPMAKRTPGLPGLSACHEPFGT